MKIYALLFRGNILKFIFILCIRKFTLKMKQKKKVKIISINKFYIIKNFKLLTTKNKKL